jgi:hypothetical protein
MGDCAFGEAASTGLPSALLLIRQLRSSSGLSEVSHRRGCFSDPGLLHDGCKAHATGEPTARSLCIEYRPHTFPFNGLYLPRDIPEAFSGKLCRYVRRMLPHCLRTSAERHALRKECEGALLAAAASRWPDNDYFRRLCAHLILESRQRSGQRWRPRPRRLHITRARVLRRNKDRTKTGVDRGVELCPRARAIIKRHVALWADYVAANKIHHRALFFHVDGSPISDPEVTRVRPREFSTRSGKRCRRRAVRREAPEFGSRHSELSAENHYKNTWRRGWWSIPNVSY